MVNFESTLYKAQPLHVACLAASELLVRELMQTPAGIVDQLEAEIVSFSDDKKQTKPLHLAAKPLHLAAAGGSAPVVQLLLQARAEIDSKRQQETEQRREDPTTPLHQAVASGRLRAAELLLQNQADIERRSGTGEPPLHLAVRSHDTTWDEGALMVKLLLRHRADPAQKDSRTVLHLVADQIRLCPREILAALKIRAEQEDNSVRVNIGHMEMLATQVNDETSLVLKTGEHTIRTTMPSMGNTPWMAAIRAGFPPERIHLLADRCIETVIEMAKIDRESAAEALKHGGAKAEHIVTLLHVAPEVAKDVLTALTMKPEVEDPIKNPLPSCAATFPYETRRAKYATSSKWVSSCSSSQLWQAQLADSAFLPEIESLTQCR
eukprot:1072405-Amphidinium_carterae.1